MAALTTVIAGATPSAVREMYPDRATRDALLLLENIKGTLRQASGQSPSPGEVSNSLGNRFSQMTVVRDQEPGSGERLRKAARDVIDVGGASVVSREEKQHDPADREHMHYRHLKQAELEKPACEVLPSREAKHLLTAKDKAKKQQEAKQRLLNAGTCAESVGLRRHALSVLRALDV